MIEVGRRIGVALHGVGMPGHFLVGVDGDPGEFIDPFHAGAVLDRAGCPIAIRGDVRIAIPLHRAVPRAHEFAPDPAADGHQPAAHVPRRRSPNARWAAGLRLAFPEIPPEERERTAEVLASVGATAEAAAVLDELAAAGAGAAADRWSRQATAYRSQSN